MNQLVREDNVDEGTMTLFDYDNAGNITARHIFDYWAGCPTFQYRSLIGCDPSYEVVNYGYSNGAWGDLLASYIGTTITYDAIKEIENEYEKAGKELLYPKEKK